MVSPLGRHRANSGMRRFTASARAACANVQRAERRLPWWWNNWQFGPSCQTRVLQHLVASFAPAGWLLLAFDTIRERKELDNRYGSEINHKFILNIMQRAAETFPRFGLNPDLFAYTPQYLERSGQCAHIVTATAAQSCWFVDIVPGQPFHIINTYKFASNVFESAVEAISCTVDYRAFDAESGGAVYLIQTPPQNRSCVSTNILNATLQVVRE